MERKYIYGDLLTESGLMKVAEFEKVSFDQFVQDWEKQIVRYPEEFFQSMVV